jgi:hypothetical protein
MITIDVSASDGCLRINCAGCYGPRSEGNSASGRLVQEAIRRHLDTANPSLVEVVIVFTRIDYEGLGDGPIWSVMQASRRGVKVTYLVSDRTREPLEELLSVTNMDRIIGVTVVRDAGPVVKADNMGDHAERAIAPDGPGLSGFGEDNGSEGPPRR